MISNVSMPLSGNLKLNSTVYAAIYTDSKPPLIAKGSFTKEINMQTTEICLLLPH